MSTSTGRHQSSKYGIRFLFVDFRRVLFFPKQRCLKIVLSSATNVQTTPLTARNLAHLAYSGDNYSLDRYLHTAAANDHYCFFARMQDLSSHEADMQQRMKNFEEHMKK